MAQVFSEIMGQAYDHTKTHGSTEIFCFLLFPGFMYKQKPAEDTVHISVDCSYSDIDTKQKNDIETVLKKSVFEKQQFPKSLSLDILDHIFSS